MARIPREHLVAEGTVNHCTWRSHDDLRVFEEPGAREYFLGLLAKYKVVYEILIFSYCLMGTHPHVVCQSLLDQQAFSAFWQSVNQAFAKWYNARRGRRGQVIRERMRSPRIEPDGLHLMTVMRYGDLNPVRAGLVASAGDWTWSSFRHYAYGDENPLIDDAPDYLALGKNAVQRREAYQAWFAQPLASESLAKRAELVSVPFVGSERWVAEQRAEHGLSPPRRTAAPS